MKTFSESKSSHGITFSILKKKKKIQVQFRNRAYFFHDFVTNFFKKFVYLFVLFSVFLPLLKNVFLPSPKPCLCFSNYMVYYRSKNTNYIFWVLGLPEDEKGAAKIFFLCVCLKFFFNFKKKNNFFFGVCLFCFCARSSSVFLSDALSD